MYVALFEQVVLNSRARCHQYADRCHQYADDTLLYMRLTPGFNIFGDLGKCARWCCALVSVK